MTLADGDISQYELLKTGTTVDFLAKFSNFTDKIKAFQNHNQKIAQEHKKRAKRGR